MREDPLTGVVSHCPEPVCDSHPLIYRKESRITIHTYRFKPETGQVNLPPVATSKRSARSSSPEGKVTKIKPSREPTF